MDMLEHVVFINKEHLVLRNEEVDEKTLLLFVIESFRIVKDNR